MMPLHQSQFSDSNACPRKIVGDLLADAPGLISCLFVTRVILISATDEAVSSVFG